MLKKRGNHTTQQIANFLGVHRTTVDKWINPEYAQRQRDFNKEWQKRNKGKRSQSSSKYAKTEKGSSGKRTRCAKRRALKLGAIHDVFIDGQWVEVNMYDQMKVTPELFMDPRADKAWKELTERAQKLEKITGTKWHVDHLVPLTRGGMHVPENFALRTAKENLAKGNKLIPYDSSLYAKRIFNIK